jgi:hypothetical protein
MKLQNISYIIVDPICVFLLSNTFGLKLYGVIWGKNIAEIFYCLSLYYFIDKNSLSINGGIYKVLIIIL